MLPTSLRGVGGGGGHLPKLSCLLLGGGARVSRGSIFLLPVIACVAVRSGGGVWWWRFDRTIDVRGLVFVACLFLRRLALSPAPSLLIINQKSVQANLTCPIDRVGSHPDQVAVLQLSPWYRHPAVQHNKHFSKYYT